MGRTSSLSPLDIHRHRQLPLLLVHGLLMMSIKWKDVLIAPANCRAMQSKWWLQRKGRGTIRKREREREETVLLCAGFHSLWEWSHEYNVCVKWETCLSNEGTRVAQWLSDDGKIQANRWAGSRQQVHSMYSVTWSTCILSLSFLLCFAIARKNKSLSVEEWPTADRGGRQTHLMWLDSWAQVMGCRGDWSMWWHKRPRWPCYCDVCACIWLSNVLGTRIHCIHFKWIC